MVLRKPAIPAYRPPQLATLVKRVPSGGGWLFEPKLDGYRCLAAVSGEQVRLWTRNGIDFRPRAPYIAEALGGLTDGSALLDGEVCAIDERGRTNFSLLKDSLGTNRLSYFVFDLLEQNGHDLTRIAQAERKLLLEALLTNLPDDAPIRFVAHIEGHGQELLDAMCAGGHEGVIAKRANAPYRPGDRSDDWLKIKCIQRQEFIVIGWRDPDYGEDVRALYLATNENGKLVYRGRVGTGFTDRERQRVLAILKPHEIEQPAVTGIPRPDAKHGRWIEPVMVAEVEYSELTPDGHIRHPSYQGLREDKPAADVHIEVARS